MLPPKNKFLLAAVIGMPIMHSRSPLMHNYWFNKYQLKGSYVPLAIQPKNLEGALRGLHPLGFSGCNVTIPHKQTVIPYLDELSPVAKAIGAVSCIHAREDGSLYGTNNDAFGFIRNIKHSNPNWRADQGPVVVIGAGGGARAVCYGLLEEGAREIRIINRTKEKSEHLAQNLGQGIKVLDWKEREESLRDCGTLVNTSSLGMTGQPSLDLKLDALNKDALVTDIVYVPLETDLIKQARLKGNQTVSGLGMLIHQGPLAWKLWFDFEPEVTDELRLLLENNIQA